MRGKKKIDLFEIARVDRSRPLADTYKTLQGLIDEGLFDHIGISEASAETVREANSIVPVAAVEIEVSPWSYEEETKKGDCACLALRRWEYLMRYQYSYCDVRGARYYRRRILVRPNQRDAADLF